MIVGAGACWGLSAVIAKVAFDRGVPPVRMAEARVIVALAVLLAYLAWRGRDLVRPPAGSVPVLAAFGLFVAGVNASYYVAIDRLPVGVAISLQYTAPTLLLGAVTFSRRRSGSAAVGPGRAAWPAAACTLSGAILVSRAYAGLHEISGSKVVADINSALFFALYLLNTDAAEWVLDWHGPYAPEPQVDPVGSRSGIARVVRGGGIMGPSENMLQYRTVSGFVEAIGRPTSGKRRRSTRVSAV